MAPRIGVVFDLTGDGKTVLKGNYGLFWHNPGVGVGGNANPNTAAKSATYAWNDAQRRSALAAGRRRRTPAQPSLEGGDQVDPNIKAPYTHEASVWLERQLTDTMGVRAGFVYKTEDDLIATYQPGRGRCHASTRVPFTFVDIGVDGRARHGRRQQHHDARPAERAPAAQLPDDPGRDERRRSSRATRPSRSR